MHPCLQRFNGLTRRPSPVRPAVPGDRPVVEACSSESLEPRPEHNRARLLCSPPSFPRPARARACPTLNGMGKDRQTHRAGPQCSFCDKADERVRRMVAGPRGVYICNECVDLCNDIFSELEPQPEAFRWADLVDQQPALGAVAEEKLLKPGVILVGTTRRDGSARISGVEPLVMDGELWLSMMTTSTKALDLRRDPRISINSIVTGPEPAVEVKVRGTARVVHDLEVQERYAAKVSAELAWQPVVGQFTLFAIDIFDVAQVAYDPKTHGQHVARWPAGEEYVRPTTTPTSLGPRQTVRRLLQ